MERIKLNVLYVEDQRSVRSLFSDYFENVFDEFYVCKDGEEALELYNILQLRNKSIDLVITDIEMPKVSGFELLKKIRQYNTDLHAIIISSLDFGNYIDEINDISKVNFFIKKSTPIKEIYEKILDIYPKIEASKHFKFQYSLTQQYQNLMDDFAIITKTDYDGKITYVNKAFCDISGYTKEELLGNNHNIVRDPDVPEDIFATMWKTIKAKMSFHYHALPNIAKDGRKYYVDTLVFPILDIDRNIHEFMSIRYDVTSFIESIESEKKAKNAQKQFLANMSHEIRTPLNGILGFTHLLKQSNSLNDTDKEYIDTINESGLNLMNIINDILDISKIQSGKMTLDKNIFNIVEESKTIFRLFKAKADEKNIKYSFTFDEHLENIFVKGDEVKLKQIFSNLISNAIKFTPEYGTIDSKLECLKIEENSVDLVYTISDTGIGMGEEYLKNLFNPFVQEDSSIARKYGGSGLGVAICKEIVDLMGGDIKVQSKKNVGTSFTVYITLPVENNYKLPKKEIIIESSSLQGTILVAEDVLINQKLMKISLERMGLDVLFANDGEEAIKVFHENKEIISLVLMDINMPIVDGIQAMREINKSNTHHTIPMIALTANATKGDKEKYLKEGFDDYLSKPINNHDLQVCLSKYLNLNKVKEKEHNLDNHNILEDLATKLDLPLELYQELFSEYLNGLESDLEELKQAILKNDQKTIANIAHKLKGTSGNLGLDELFNLFKELETTNGDYNNLLKSINEVLKRLKSYI